MQFTDSRPYNNYGHYCYVLLSESTGRYYIGYSVDVSRRLRQHNGEITGGAKKTTKGRPWSIICIISGFVEECQAMRFEYRLQKSRRKRKNENIYTYVGDILSKLVGCTDGPLNWPCLCIQWV